MDFKERIALLIQCEKSPEMQAIQMELCKRDPVYWFNTFAYTFDPRKDVPDMPFNLYDYQEWTIKEWLECLEVQEDFCVEKSRDMGVSWLIMLLFMYCWLFKPGYNFHVGSRREDEVDNALVDPSKTLFGKFRYALYKLPRWMRPPEMKKHDKKLSIINPTNGNIITGESANPSFARGGRFRCVLFDELAFWETADTSWASASQSTRCRIALSTPYGETNKYARIMNDKNNEYREYPREQEIRREKGLAA